MIMETLIYEKLGKGRVRCGICRHFCVISEGERGLCMVRKNIKGRLLCLSYPKLVAAGVDPIEKNLCFISGLDRYPIPLHQWDAISSVISVRIQI